MFLELFCNFRDIGDRFDVSKSTLWLAVKETVSAIARLSLTQIRWPTVQQMNESERAYRRRSGFPGIIGAVDGSFIPIKAPLENPESYYNGKGFYSIILQGVANSKYVSMYIYMYD